METWKVGIVGGGPGGLMTAYTLQKLATGPYQATIFEASDRLGGKILTRRFSLAPVSYEAGAAELYDYSPVEEDSLKELVAELGLATRPMRGSAVVMNDRVLSNLDDVRDHLGPQARDALAAFDRAARDHVSPNEFYHSDEPGPGHRDESARRFDRFLAGIGDEGARRYVENLIHSDLATEPEKTSVVYGLHNYVMNHPAYMGLYSIEGGNELLPRELAARTRAAKRLGHTVTHVAREGTRLRVTSAHAGHTRHDDFDFVVLALPNSYLPTISFGGDRLAGAMRRHHDHYDHPAHYLRVTVLFDRPFWRGGPLDESYCMLDRFGGCCLYDESSRDAGIEHGVLGWLLGGDAAQEMSRLGDAELIAAALDSLPEFLAHGRRHVLEGRVHRWVGAVSAMPGGAAPRGLDRRHQPEPVDHPNLFAVGDYLYDSTLNGVLDSAEYVAGWVAARMTEAPGPRPTHRTHTTTHRRVLHVAR